MVLYQSQEELSRLNVTIHPCMLILFIFIHVVGVDVLQALIVNVIPLLKFGTQPVEELAFGDLVEQL